ncbi:hypothetical protein V6N13_143560 [Hibiscus sabdariffa]|uniref:Uncharacterized protein n=1 Tax=Hibiscus sabdariffa TaxID=183260 RepID=A0ABR2FHX2_9ROSI
MKFNDKSSGRHGHPVEPSASESTFTGSVTIQEWHVSVKGTICNKIARALLRPKRSMHTKFIYSSCLSSNPSTMFEESPFFVVILRILVQLLQIPELSELEFRGLSWISGGFR